MSVARTSATPLSPIRIWPFIVGEPFHLLSMVFSLLISVFVIIIWRQKKGMGMAIDGSVADDLAGIVDARCRNESPARARWDEFIEVIHLAFAGDVRMLLPTGDC